VAFKGLGKFVTFLGLDALLFVEGLLAEIDLVADDHDH
jgi:hypothetical protein